MLPRSEEYTTQQLAWLGADSCGRNGHRCLAHDSRQMSTSVAIDVKGMGKASGSVKVVKVLGGTRARGPLTVVVHPLGEVAAQRCIAEEWCRADPGDNLVD